jgi:hypothetical protein
MSALFALALPNWRHCNMVCARWACARLACAVFALLILSHAPGCSPSRPSDESPAKQVTEQAEQTATKAEEAAVPVPAAPESPPAGPLPRFADITEASGIQFERFDDIRGLHRIHESTGGGVALFDYDGDGLLDVLLTNGCTLPLKYRDEAHPSQLYRNLGNNRFLAVTKPCGFDCNGYSQGVAVGDFNSDGFEDFYIAAYGRNSLWQNNGDGTFTDVTEATGANDQRWSTSAAFADFDNDGLLDLYVVNYIDAADDPPKLCPNKLSPDGYVQCPPTNFPAVDDLLLLNDGSGRFLDATQQAGIDGVDGKGLSAVVFDANRDGRADIFVANDGTPNFLYIHDTQRPDDERSGGERVHFQEQSSLQGVALNLEGKAQACMGIACGDYDQDGFADLFVTNFFAETNTLYRNLQGQGFEDATNSSRLGPPSRPMLAFGTEFIDFDNDSWLDLVLANGHIDDLSWANPDETYRMPPQFFRNDQNGTFTDVSRWSGDYFQKNWLGRGLVVGDLDNDGDQDFVVSHQLAPSAVVSNQTEANGSSVVIRLIGRQSNRSAVNTRIEALWPERTVVREVVGGGSFQSSSDRRAHIGLGKQESIPQLTIRWPSGHVDQWQNVAAGMYVAIEGQEMVSQPQPAP